MTWWRTRRRQQRPIWKTQDTLPLAFRLCTTQVGRDAAPPASIVVTGICTLVRRLLLMP